MASHCTSFMNKGNNMRSPIVVVLACMLITGCVSTVDVKKVETNDTHTNGLRYYLPQVFLVVTPAKDGTMTVETRYEADPAHQYAITTTSFLGNYAIDVTRTPEGFLETVTFSSNSAELVKQLASSQAAVRVAEIEAGAAKNKADSEQAKAAADKLAAAAAAERQAVAEAEAAVRIASAKLQTLRAFEGKAGAPADIAAQIVAAEVAQAEAATRLELARERIAASMTAAGIANANSLAASGAGANAPGVGGAIGTPAPPAIGANTTAAATEGFGLPAHSSASTPGAAPAIAPPTGSVSGAATTAVLSTTAESSAPGPLFLKVNMLPDTVELIPAFNQDRFTTWEIPSARNVTPDLEMYPGRLVVRPERGSGALRFLLRTNVPLLDIKFVRATDLKDRKLITWAPAEQPVAAVQADKTSVRVDLPKKLKAGDYELEMTFKSGPAANPISTTKLLGVRVEK